VNRVVVTTGGTGGHIFPALAVAEALRERHPDIDLLFIGGSFGQEGRLAEKAGLRFRALPARGVLGRGLRSVGSVVWLSRSLLKCWLIFRRFKPDLVVGFGSYAGFVPVLLGSWLGIPTAIHEQNNRPGMTNRILGRRVSRVFLSFPDEKGFFAPEKVAVTGNPVRKSVLRVTEEEKRYTHQKGCNLLVFGGSQGASAINAAMIKALPSLASMGINIVHQSGEAELDKVKEAYGQHGFDQGSVVSFIDDIAAVYAWSDLVICRAGASTLAELTVVGRPSILIPFPYAVHEHQLTNARYLEQAGAAIVLEQSYLDGINLAQVIEDLLALPRQLQEMGRAAKNLGQPEAVDAIVDALESLHRERGRTTNEEDIERRQ
jgi:UDP-N-acetylglucosamine--N-acetylmuramyl-(pentapeptide) pyrophosphoryl-undecaprenol N-acetylglucosamine transferase